MSQPTTSTVFTLDELWLLQSAIRHEMPQQDAWHFPPASAVLNDQIAEALLRCDEASLAEAAIVLSRGDCLAIDYSVSQQAKSSAGLPIGKSVLMKSYRARRAIDEGDVMTAAEPVAPDKDRLAQELEEWKNRRRRRRSA